MPGYQVNRIGIISMMLILFLIIPVISSKILLSLTLTDTIYTVPADGIEISLKDELHRLENNYRIDQVEIGFGLLTDLSVFIYSQFLHEDFIRTGRDELGDTFLKFSYFINDYFEGFLHTGLTFQFRFPTGVNTTADSTWEDITLGENELKVGSVSRIDIMKRVFLHLNIFYFFREGYNEDLYGLFYLNPFRKETYSKVLGLNFFSEGTFFEGKRLKNDYGGVSFAVNSDLIYPVIPFFEVFLAKGIKGGDARDEKPLFPGGADPLLLSAGFRYFFPGINYLGFYSVLNPRDINEKVRIIIGIDAGIQF